MSTQTESVKIVISAEDNSAVVLAQTTAKLKEQEKTIKAVGRSYQDGGDSVGKFARMLGAGWIADAADNVKELADGALKARDSMAAGGKSSALMKAGLMALAATAGIVVGKAIGDLVWQTKRWTEELDLAIKKSGELSSAFTGAMGQRFSDESREIDLESDPSKKRAMQQDQLDFIRQQRDGMAASIKQDEEKLRIQNESWGATLSFGQAGKALRDLEAANIENRKKSLEVLKQQADELTRTLGPIEAEYQAKKKATEETKAALSLQNQLNDAIAHQSMSAKDFEIMTALRVTSNAEEQKAIKLLIEKKHAIADEKKQQEALAASRKEVQLARAKTISDGLFDRLKEAQANGKVDTSSKTLNASESRFLSRSTGTQDLQRQQLEHAKKTAEIQKASKAVLDNMAGNIKTLADRLGITNIVEFN